MSYHTKEVAKCMASRDQNTKTAPDWVREGHMRNHPGATLGIADAKAITPTTLEHIDNVLNQRIMRLDVLLENFEAILARMTGPKPQTPSAQRPDTETNSGGRLGSVCNSCEVLDRQLDHLQNVLDSLNSIA